MGARSIRFGAVVVAATALLAAACSQAPPVQAGQRTGVAQRVVSVELTGAVSYSHSATVSGGAVGVTYASNSGVTALAGTVEFPGRDGGTATVTFNLTAALGSYDGSVAVSDPTAGVSRSVTHTLVPISFDDDGDATVTTSAGGVTMTWSLETVNTPGLDVDLDAAHDLEADFCRDAQRILSSLDDTQLPNAAMGNVVHSSRAAYGASKASLVPHELQTWTDVDMVTTAAGEAVAISHRISCKTRSADHLATIGLPAVAGPACSALNQHSIDLARALMTPAQLDAYDTTGRQVVLGPDKNNSTGNDYLTPFTDEVVVGAELHVRASALRTSWSDPASAFLPENIRGVAYCTVWSPAWAYWWMTAGAFA